MSDVLRNLQDPEGIVHVNASIPLYGGHAVDGECETLCEYRDRPAVYWHGWMLEPTNLAPTCLMCVASEDPEPLFE